MHHYKLKKYVKLYSCCLQQSGHYIQYDFSVEKDIQGKNYGLVYEEHTDGIAKILEEISLSYPNKRICLLKTEPTLL
jgi:hypothetical protein